MTTDVTTQSIAEKISVRIIPIMLVGVGFCVMATAGFFFLTPKKVTPPPPTVEQLTSQLISVVDTYATATTDQQKASVVLSLHDLASRRKLLMQKLTTTNPTKFLKVALSDQQLIKFPAEIESDLERPVTREGKFMILHFDPMEGGTGRNEYYLRPSDGGDDISLVFTDDQDIEANARIRVKGVQLGTTIVLSPRPTLNASTGVDVIESAVATALLGDSKIAVIMIDFLDYHPTTAPDVMHEKMFTNSNSVHAYYQESSYDQAALIGNGVHPTGTHPDIYGWYTLNVNNPGGTAPCNWGFWVPTAITTAEGDGYNAADYDKTVYIWPTTTDCGASGWAWVGGDEAFINGGTGTSIIGHELGHDYGLHHANFFVCGSQSLAITGCTSQEYGDPYDIMNNFPGTARQMNAPHRQALGWFTLPNEMRTVAHSSSPQTFVIAPIECRWPTAGCPIIGSTTVTKTIRIPRLYQSGVPVQYFYVELRRTFGAFDNFSGYPRGLGVFVRLDTVCVDTPTSSDEQTCLIDASPGDGNQPQSAIPVGGVISDPVSGVEIKNETPDDAYTAKVTVTFGCGHTNPTIIAAAPNPAPTAKPNVPLNYQVTLWNNDNVSCPPSTFSVTAALPGPEWALTGAPTNTVIAPQSSIVTTITVNSPLTAPDGYHQIQPTVRNDAYPSLTHSTYIQYPIDTTPSGLTMVTTPPDLTILPATGTTNVSLYITGDSFSPSIFIDGVLAKQCSNYSSVCSYLWPMPASSGAHLIKGSVADTWGNMATKYLWVNTYGGGGHLPCGTDQDLPPCPLETQ